MVRAALRWEISRLRVSSKRFPSAPYRHASPLEMTVLASAPLVISTEAKRSGEIPLMVRAALRWEISRLRVSSKRFPSNTHTGASPARDDDIGGHPYRHFDQSEAEWRNLTPPWYRKHWGGRSLDSEFHQSFSICPIPTCISARDDDVGERPYRHFDRSEAEWRNLTPQWARKRVRLSPLVV